MKKTPAHQCINTNETSLINNQCNRRKVLKFAAITAGVALSFPVLPLISRATAAKKQVKIRGTSTGRILLSHDDGITWQVTADLGKECPVLDIRSTAAGFYADIKHKGYRFTLKSADGFQWKG